MEILWLFIIGGAVLLAAEMFLPGFFLLWVGLASFMTGAIFTFIPASWQVQVLTFVALALIYVYIGKRFFHYGQEKSEDPLLNQPHLRLIGQRFSLQHAISQGVSELKIGDTTWRLLGDDLPKGSLVEVVEIVGGRLRVRGV